MLITTYMDEQLDRESREAAQWSRVSEILGAALELPAPERAAFLDASCGADVSLRLEVESLLAAAGHTGFIDAAPLDLPEPTISVDAYLKAIESSALRPGQTVAHYTITRKIGEGGMGIVYQALDQRLNRKVAIKVVSRVRGTGIEARRFFLEARAASALNHPNIITIHEYNSDHGMDYMVMEYVEGATLDALLRERELTASNLKKMVDYASQMAAALAAAHQAGIVHRDLKPGNIMITASGETVKILDFGLAKATGDTSTGTDNDRLTRTGAMYGTPSFMSPEQAKGESVDHRSDIFSFGIILYQMMCGRKPFEGDTTEVLYSIVHKDPVPADKVNPLLPQNLVNLIARCLHKNKYDRVQSMAEIREALRDETPVAAAASVAKPSGSRGKLAAAAALAALVPVAVWLRAKPATERVLNYSLLEQTPGIDPRPASTTETFHAGDKFRLRLQSPQPGFLYLITEGPGDNGAKRFWVLYPPADSSAALESNHPIDTAWYVFDQNPGTERLWLAFADKPIPALQSAGRGEVKDSAQAMKMSDFLNRLGPSTRTVTQGSDVQLRAPEGVLGEVVELRHQ